MSRIFKALERAEAESRRPVGEPVVAPHVLTPASTHDLDLPEPSEEYERLKVMLALAASRSGLRSVMLLSALPREGVSTVTLGLSVALATAAPQGVLAIDLGPSWPMLARRLGVAPVHGVGDVLAKRVGADKAIVPTPVGRLSFLGGGRMPADPAHARTLTMLEELFGDLRVSFDHILVDGGALAESPTPLLLSRLVDGVVLVVQAERTGAEAVRDTAGQLRKAGANLLGVVLNRRREYLPQALARRL
jgi:Mrp family chromosome partitioning ATPase